MLRANATPILPNCPAGKPSSLESFFHVLPPSTVICKPLPAPPLFKFHGVLLNCHIAAMSLFGFDGSITRSAQPVVSLAYKILFHVSPPSVVLKTPLSGCSA